MISSGLVVYAAYDPELDRKVAIKLLLGERHDAEDQARLVREAQAMARLSHTHVVHVHDVGTTPEGAVFVAMEYIEGQTLTAWLESTRRTPAAIIEIFRQAGEGLAAAHTVGLTHRDFKPDNVLLTADGQAKISDFGLARAANASTPMPVSSHVSESDHLLTQTGAILGTPAYMAPEQHLGGQADARSDQYSFCVALFEALYGHRPFTGKSLGELRLHVMAGHVEEPSQTKVPRWIFPIVARGLELDPEDRWPTIRALLETLRRDPNRARRRWLAGLCAVALSGAGALGIQQWRAAEVNTAMRECTSSAEQLRAYWTDERPRLRRSIRAVGTPRAERRATLVEEALDDVVVRLRATEVETCEAAVLSDAVTPDMLDLRRGCLRRQRSGVEIIVDLFKDADPALLDRTRELLSTLPSPERCADLRYLARIDLDDAEAPIRKEVEDLRRRLFRVQAEIIAGRYKDGQEQIPALLDEATQLGSLKLLAQVQLSHGHLVAQGGELDTALASFLSSLRNALEVGDDHLAAEAANNLAYHTGYYRGSIAEGLRWSSVAAGLVERVDDHDLRLQNLSYTGILLNMDGRYEAALASFDRAHDLAAKVGSKGHNNAALATNRGVILSALGRREEALTEHRRALDLLVSEFGDEHPDVALTWNSIGTTHLIDGDLPRATEAFERARAIQEEALSGNHPLLALTFINLAGVAVERGDFESALPYGEQALAIMRQTDPDSQHTFTGYAELIIGQALHQRGDPATSTHIANAQTIIETNLGADHLHASFPLLIQAQLALDEGSLDRAASLLERAHRLQADNAEMSEADYAKTNVVRGRLAIAKGAAEEAARMLDDADRTYQRLQHYEHRRPEIAELRAQLKLSP